MKQIILAGNASYPLSGAVMENIAAGAVGIYTRNSLGIGEVITETGPAAFNKELELVLGRSNSEKYTSSDNLIIPINTHDFSFVKGEYQPASNFNATINIIEINNIGEYTIIIAKKGVGFNERNKWSISIYNKDLNRTISSFANEFSKKINDLESIIGLRSSTSGNIINLFNNSDTTDYNIILTDNFKTGDDINSSNVIITTKGLPAYGDAAYVSDLIEKAAADHGFEYTYKDAYSYLYPGFNTNPLSVPNKIDVGFIIFTLRFSEPSYVKTKNEVVNQIVQVVFPNEELAKGAAIKFEQVCIKLANGK